MPAVGMVGMLNGCMVSHLSEFRYGKAPILIATDVASRGLGQYSLKGHPFVVSVEYILKKVLLLSLTFTYAFSEFFSP